MYMLAFETVSAILRPVIDKKISFVQIFMVTQDESFVSRSVGRLAEMLLNPFEFMNPGRWILPGRG